MTTTTKTTRGSSALKGAVAAGAATAILLGGFGAFALWSDTQNAGAAGQIQTGVLKLDPITAPVQWQLDNPQSGAPAPIDLSTFKASPGDVISYTVTATGTVTGTDITASLDVDLGDVQLDPALESGDVTITATGAGGAPIEIVGTDAGNQFSQEVTVTIAFDEAMTGGMNLPAAVDMDGLVLRLQQL